MTFFYTCLHTFFEYQQFIKRCQVLKEEKKKKRNSISRGFYLKNPPRVATLCDNRKQGVSFVYGAICQHRYSIWFLRSLLSILKRGISLCRYRGSSFDWLRDAPPPSFIHFIYTELYKANNLNAVKGPSSCNNSKKKRNKCNKKREMPTNMCCVHGGEDTCIPPVKKVLLLFFCCACVLLYIYS